MKTTATLFALIFCLFISCTPKDDGLNRIKIHFDGDEAFDKLSLILHCEDDKRISIDGDSQNGKTWLFIYPDSIYEQIRYFEIEKPRETENAVYRMGFTYINNQDTMTAVSVSFNRKSSEIRTSFMQTDTFPNQLAFNKNNEVVPITIYRYTYQVTSFDDKELLFSIEFLAGRYSLFPNRLDPVHYAQNLDKYVDFTKKYPDSHKLMERFYSTLTNYNSKEDIEKVYANFTEQNRLSYYGKKVSEYLADNNFENITLTGWDTNAPEPIIKDKSKYNLVVFSASWCVPCHEQIPVLKEIYTDLKDKLDITYISMDEQSTRGAWHKLMIEKEIPWRSVIADDKLEAVKEAYTVQSIPHTLLVYPDGLMKKIDVRIASNKEELYNTVRKL